MTRLLQRCRRLHVAATLAMFVVAVLVAHVDDYGMLSRTASPPGVAFASPGAGADAFAPASASRPDAGHDCSCSLCIVTVSDSLRKRLVPPSAGTLPPVGPAAAAGSPDLSEVFHPPSA